MLSGAGEYELEELSGRVVMMRREVYGVASGYCSTWVVLHAIAMCVDGAMVSYLPDAVLAS